MDTKQLFDNLKKMNDYAHSMSQFSHAPGKSKRDIAIALDYQKRFLEIYYKIKDEPLTLPYHKQLFDEAIGHYNYFSKGLIE